MATKEEVTGVPRRVGRPRLLPAPRNDLEPREQILRAAAALFATRGYSATSTRLIAEHVGVRQASLFHHFRRKEDMLAELLDRTVRPALAFSALLDEELLPPAAALFALAAFDVGNLCSRPDNVAGLQLLPEARDERFGTFWEDRERLRTAYGTRIALLVPDGEDVLATDLVFGVIESVLTWYERDGELPADRVAAAIGRAALAIIGLPKSAIGRAEREAKAVGLGRPEGDGGPAVATSEGAPAS